MLADYLFIYSALHEQLCPLELIKLNIFFKLSKSFSKMKDGDSGNSCNDIIVIILSKMCRC